MALTRRLPAVLRWGPETHELVAVGLSGHVRVVQDRLVPLLPELTQNQLAELVGLDDRGWHRLLADPSAVGLLCAGLGSAEPAATVAALLDGLRARPGAMVHGIPVDVSSARTAPVFARLDAAFDGAADHGEAELERVGHILRAALGAAAANEYVESVIVGCVRTISVRRDASRTPSSSSWPPLPGYLRLWNADLGDLCWTVDALVHEAVHGLLYMIEEQESWFTDRAAWRTSSMRSPWSGRDLPLHSFVHACFVWFALLCFWADAELDGADGMFRQASKGFESGRLPVLIRSLHTVDAGVREVLLELVAQAEQVISCVREPVR
ncbi:aKG-HExxH-type peptide beta-hydroxylase [Kitasatospora griseola]|uniref:aKG-HExxH-type peptide beta-hydroxylase n=1 Tax=Kitasatospora griseola TaxID=2064 RepID=UPI00166FACA5|nr:HEXXH motif-containing putative peptide modification protein [Kitasatospora griseola]